MRVYIYLYVYLGMCETLWEVPGLWPCPSVAPGSEMVWGLMAGGTSGWGGQQDMGTPWGSPRAGGARRVLVPTGTSCCPHVLPGSLPALHRPCLINHGRRLPAAYLLL